MKRRRVTALVFVILSSITFWIIVRNTNSTIKKELRDFAVEDTGSIAKIILSDHNSHLVTLVRKKTNVWMVNDKYSARPDGINTLLQTIKQMAVRNPVGNAMKDNVVKDLAASGIKVEVYAGDELIKLFFVGGQTADMTGTFMLLADPETKMNSSVPFEMCIPGFDGFLTTRFVVRESDWRERIIFRSIPPEIKIIRVEYLQLPNNGFEIAVENNARSFRLKTLSPDKPVSGFDTASVRQYLAYYQNIQYEVIEKLERSFIDSVIATQPLGIIMITDINGKTNTAKIFYKPAADGAVDREGKPLKYDEDRIFALINDGQDFVTIQYFVFGKLLQPVGYFLPKSIVKN